MNSLVKSNFNFLKFDRSKTLLFSQLNDCRHNYLVSRFCSSKEKPEQTAILVEEEESAEENERKIEKIRNKSRLRLDHYNQLYDKVPYTKPVYEYHYSVSYNRKMIGKYGIASGMNPGVSWPTKNDLKNRQEYEKVAYPFTVQELVNLAKKDLEARELEIQMDHERVLANMAKLEKWKTDLKEKIAKKEADAIAAKQKKEKLIEEVRRHFGFTVDPRDERFKEMLAAKEKEQKKKDKQAKLDERERKALSRLMSKQETNVADSSKLNNNQA